MKIIALPDLHEATTHLESISGTLSSVNLVLLVGDLTNSGSIRNIARVVDEVRRYNASILAVPGNWDKPEVENYLDQEGISLHRRHVVIEGIAFLGAGAALHSPNRSPNEVSEEDFERFLAEAASGLDNSFPKVLVCHQPPIQSAVDKTWSGLHIGSKAIRTFIDETAPLICFSGHVHEGVGIDDIGSTKLINPGPIWDGRYAYAEITEHQLTVLEIRKR